MKIAVRGEGSTDIGALNHDGSLEKGPMLILLEKLDCLKKYLLKVGWYEELNQDDFVEWVYIHKEDIGKSSDSRKKSILRSKKSQRKGLENNSLLKGFYKNSESFAFLAKEKKSDIAIFFVDADKETHERRYNAVKQGLSQNGFDKTGIPMIPIKISESWLLCCLNKYQNCADYENLTTDNPKKICINSGVTRHEIARNCDPNKINMPSFNKFREDFKIAINTCMKYDICK